MKKNRRVTHYTRTINFIPCVQLIQFIFSQVSPSTLPMQPQGVLWPCWVCRPKMFIVILRCNEDSTKNCAYFDH